MARPQKLACPECEAPNRRAFLETLTRGAVVLGGMAPLAAHAADTASSAAASTEKPAEAMIRELYSTLSEDQKRSVVYAWDHGSDSGMPTRLKMVNAPHFGKRIGEAYTKPQQELLQTILKSMCSGEDGYQKISRNGKFDGSGQFTGIGAVLFGEPTDGKKYSMVFAGHHLTVRCDGNSEPGAAFGGPMYYGHSPQGYSEQNVFSYQTKSVRSVYDALDPDQRKKAVVVDSTPGEQYESVRLDKKGEKPGVGFSELSADQKQLVEKVMRDVLSPYRKEDADEVMTIIKGRGGMEQINLAFYRVDGSSDKEPWKFWRLEGPGFVWNFRVLPHVHTFVNISAQV